MTFAQQMITLAMCVLGTVAMRFLPFAVFSGRDLPAFVRYLGQVLPGALFGVLVVYCLKGVTLTGPPYGLPEAIALALVVAVHLWQRKTLLSIAAGTVCYMILIQHFC